MMSIVFINYFERLSVAWQFCFSGVCKIRYDTIRYSRFTCAQKLTRWQLNLTHGPETKNNEKIKIKNRVAQKKRCRQKSVEAVREEEVKLRG